MALEIRYKEPVNEIHSTPYGNVQFVNGVSMGITQAQFDYMNRPRLFGCYEAVDVRGRRSTEPESVEVISLASPKEEQEETVETTVEAEVEAEVVEEAVVEVETEEAPPADTIDWPTSDWTNRQINAFAQERVDQGDGRFNDVLNATNKASKLEALSHLR